MSIYILHTNNFKTESNITIHVILIYIFASLTDTADVPYYSSVHGEHHPASRWSSGTWKGLQLAAPPLQVYQ